VEDGGYAETKPPPFGISRGGWSGVWRGTSAVVGVWGSNNRGWGGKKQTTNIICARICVHLSTKTQQTEGGPLNCQPGVFVCYHPTTFVFFVQHFVLFPSSLPFSCFFFSLLLSSTTPSLRGRPGARLRHRQRPGGDRGMQGRRRARTGRRHRPPTRSTTSRSTMRQRSRSPDDGRTCSPR